MGYMTTSRGHPGRDSRLVLSRYFQFDDDEVAFPSVLFFQVSGDEVVGTALMKLEEDKIEDAFLEIKQLLLDVANSLREAEGEGVRDPLELFGRVEATVRKLKAIALAKKAGAAIRSLKELFSVFSM